MEKYDNTKTYKERKKEEKNDHKKYVKKELFYGAIGIVFLVILTYFLLGINDGTTFHQPDPSVIIERQ